MNTSEILLKAADVIETNGWYRGGYCGSIEIGQNIMDTPVCVLGAINVATGHDPSEELTGDLDTYEAAQAFAEHVGVYDPDDIDWDPVDAVGTGWNDRRGRTAKQVKAKLRECAAALKASES